jgi:hypothetical protein
MPLTRREFIVGVARAGGYSATFATMQSLGLLPATAGAASAVSLPRNTGKGVKVVILGGGIAGLVSAYELAKAGFECTLLEARDRPGGRNWTVRNGTTVEFIDGTKQTARYLDSKSYFNAGPARLPSVHKTILGYCKELGVPIEVFVNANRNSLMVREKVFDGRPVEQRQVIHDARGEIAELLARSINQGALDERLTKDDHERLLAFLRTFGDLRQDLTYQGSERAGVSPIAWSGRRHREAPSSSRTWRIARRGFLERDGIRGQLRSTDANVSARRRYGSYSLCVCREARQNHSVSLNRKRDSQDCERREDHLFAERSRESDGCGLLRCSASCDDSEPN